MQSVTVPVIYEELHQKGHKKGAIMSWQEYIDDHLMAELKNQSASFPELSEAEAQAINAGFDDQVGLASKGLFVGGQKFIVVAGEEGAVIRGKAGQQGDLSSTLISFICLSSSCVLSYLAC